jgi:hypothetical protein
MTGIKNGITTHIVDITCRLFSLFAEITDIYRHSLSVTEAAKQSHKSPYRVNVSKRR